jgi:phosphohistidine swiveling domain-containing protein
VLSNKSKSKLKFSTKAKTLEDLSKAITTAKVLPIFRFLVEDFKANSDQIIKNIQQNVKGAMVIVRSSSKAEDAFEQSNAGRFLSVPNVKKSDTSLLKKAIKGVISSYSDNDRHNEVLVQTMLTNVKKIGVVFTADLDTLAPYWIINYGNKNDKIDSVTSGSFNNIKTYIRYKKNKFVCRDADLNKLLNSCREIEALFDHPFLDIEFAFDGDNTLFILQVRPIVTVYKEDLSSINLKNELSKAYNSLEKLSSKRPNLLGDKAIYGVMPDWNPAEMIGLKPKPLSLSLYKEIITDDVWAHQRYNYGYRDLKTFPLMISILGVPYIDCRVDFNSFIPKDLGSKMAEKLVNFYLNRLEKNPLLHDKIEFEIVHSCFHFNLPKRLAELLEYDFSEDEVNTIEASLIKLTAKVINQSNGLCKKDIETIEVLKSKHQEILNSEAPLIDKVYLLIKHCKQYGTLPFAGIARSAFVATQLLRSLVETGVISWRDYNLYLNSFSTVAKHMNNDLYKYSKKQTSRKDFLDKYGHLRPGTYDILSPRYDQNFDTYFTDLSSIRPSKERPFSFTRKQLKEIDLLLNQNGLGVTAQELLGFMKESIEGREYSKLIFTKILSDTLCLIEELGRSVSISKEDLAYVDIRTILGLYRNSKQNNIRGVLKKSINKNSGFYKYTKSVKLPSLIVKPSDILNFYLSHEEPNFVTLKQVRTHTTVLGKNIFHGNGLKNKIVFIESADPGYDFLFTKNIGGLVTQFGGANSHMAVRCAELGIPAVIGAGESNFIQWSRAKVLEIDCLNKKVKVIL